MLTIGLIINPMAGIGGSVALKGSDGADVVSTALARGAEPKSHQRCAIALDVLKDHWAQIRFITCPGNMGSDLLQQKGIEHHLIEAPISSPTRPEDTQAAAQALMDAGVNVILFAGGDGTARDICAVVGDSVPVLGIPAGVKIHSAVYAVTPKAAGEVILCLAKGEWVDITTNDVRDIDEEAFRNNQVRAKLYGEMRVPQVGQFVQSVKQGGVEVEELVLQDIAQDLIHDMDPEIVYFIGSGKTTQALMDELHLPNTLLGIDAIRDGELLQADLTESDLLDFLAEHECRAIISIIGGQGHIIGRGNQQFSPAVLTQLGKEQLMVIATKSKLTQLEGRPLIVDSGAPELDDAFSGTLEIITGYHDRVIYPVGL